MCAGFVELGLFHNVDKLIGMWKSFSTEGNVPEKMLQKVGVGVGVAGIGGLGALYN